MKARARDIQQRFNFIDRTLAHAIHACESDPNIPDELIEFIQLLDHQSGQARQALYSKKMSEIRQCVDDLAKLSERVQQSIPRPNTLSYDVKSAVILAHLEIETLKYQVH